MDLLQVRAKLPMLQQVLAGERLAFVEAVEGVHNRGIRIGLYADAASDFGPVEGGDDVVLARITHVKKPVRRTDGLPVVIQLHGFVARDK